MHTHTKLTWRPIYKIDKAVQITKGPLLDLTDVTNLSGVCQYVRHACI